MDIDTNEQLIAFCQEALRIPSYSGQEQGVAELMKLYQKKILEKT